MYQHKIYFEQDYIAQSGKSINPLVGNQDALRGNETPKTYLYRIIDINYPKLVAKYVKYSVKKIDLYLTKDRTEEDYICIASLVNEDNKLFLFIQSKAPEPYKTWLLDRYAGISENQQQIQSLNYRKLGIELAKTLFGNGVKGCVQKLQEMSLKMAELSQEKFVQYKAELYKQVGEEILQDAFWEMQDREAQNLEIAHRMFNRWLSELAKD